MQASLVAIIGGDTVLRVASANLNIVKHIKTMHQPAIRVQIADIFLKIDVHSFMKGLVFKNHEYNRIFVMDQ